MVQTTCQMDSGCKIYCILKFCPNRENFGWSATWHSLKLPRDSQKVHSSDMACWHGMIMWNDDMAWWCGTMTWHAKWHDDVVWWHGMMMWHDDMAWWSGMMTSMHAFVLEMSFRTFMHLLMRNCKMINIWSEWKNYSHITHLFYSLSCYEVNAWL